MTELDHQLQIERDLKAKAEAKADERMQKLEEMHSTSYEPSATAQMLSADLKTKVEVLQLEILDLNKTDQEEKTIKGLSRG